MLNSPLMVALEVACSYTKRDWEVSDEIIDFEYDGEDGAGEGLRVNAMFALQRVLNPGDVEFVSTSGLSIDMAADRLLETIMFDDEGAAEASFFGGSLTGEDLAAVWPSNELAEGVGKMVREGIEWFAADAVGGEAELATVCEVAADIAANFNPPQIESRPNLICVLRESLKWLIVGAAVAAAKGRDDMVSEFDYLLGSFWLGNPIVGLRHDGKLMVVTE